MSETPIAIEELRTHTPPGQELSIESEEGPYWSQLVLKHANGSDIALIERDPVLPGELGDEELKEYLEEIQGEKPESAVKWVTAFLSKVKVIYAIQVLHGAGENNGWDGIHSMQTVIWKKLGGILQADAEGFSNESGFHILWQFDGNPTGLYPMAVLDDQGKWRAFEMKLEDPEQRRSFLEGWVPLGTRTIG